MSNKGDLCTEMPDEVCFGRRGYVELLVDVAEGLFMRREECEVERGG